MINFVLSRRFFMLCKKTKKIKVRHYKAQTAIC